MSAEKYDQALRDFESAEQLLFKYKGLLKSALEGLENNFDRFHIYGLSGAEFCQPANVDMDEGMDGRSFPDAEKIAKAVCSRALARNKMREEWPRLSQVEQDSRQPPA